MEFENTMQPETTAQTVIAEAGPAIGPNEIKKFMNPAEL